MISMIARAMWLALLASPIFVMAQTYTSCDPLNTTCSSDPGLTTKTFTSDFTKGQNTSWSVANYTTVTYSDEGAAFTVKTKDDAPTISTDFYIFFGYIEVKMRAAPGTGIVSSIVLESDDLDEVDWEFLGGAPGAVQTNFFGKGNTTAYNRMVSVPVSSTTTTFHTYALNWTSSSLTWLIDGTAVRTLYYTDTLALGGKNYPQTPSKLKLGIWAGGASSSEGTVEWAGGATDFSKGPFTMIVESVNIVNYNSAKSYTYGDKSGDWTSIELNGATNSTSSSSSSVSTFSATSSATTMNSHTLSPSSSVIKKTTSTSTASTADHSGFVQSTNGAVKQTEAGLLGSKIIYALLAALGVFLA